MKYLINTKEMKSVRIPFKKWDKFFTILYKEAIPLMIASLMVFAISISKASAQNPALIMNTSGIYKAINVNSDIYYFRNVDSSGVQIQQLWKSGGGLSSATLVKSLGLTYNPYGPITLTRVVGNKLYFVTEVSPDGNQL